ncbi:MAG: type II secretion system protein [Verrucomicrobiales bacterium]
MRLHHHARRRARLGSSSGFTLVELLVVAAISVTILSTAVLIFQGIVKNQSRISSYGTVTLGAPTVLNYYGQASTTAVDTYVARDYGNAPRG